MRTRVGGLAQQRLVRTEDKPVHAFGCIGIALGKACGENPGQLAGLQRHLNAAIRRTGNIRVFGVFQPHGQRKVGAPNKQAIHTWNGRNAGRSRHGLGAFDLADHQRLVAGRQGLFHAQRAVARKTRRARKTALAAAELRVAHHGLGIGHAVHMRHKQTGRAHVQY